jgi:ABC-2 type transport system permease protein
VSWSTTRLTFRLRALATLSAAVGLVAVIVAVGALFPAVGHTIGKLDVPTSVANLLGGADYGTITGWYRSEIAVIYAPLVIAALAITGASAVTAGEEENRILALVLANPIPRAQLLVAKAAGVALVVIVIACAVWVGMVIGVAVGGGGISTGHISALAVQLAFFGFATGAVALALGGGTGRHALASGGAGAVAILGWLVNSFAPLVNGVAWLKYLTLFYYYSGHDPLTRGVGFTGLIVLGLVTVTLIAAAVVAFNRRDLRA